MFIYSIREGTVAANREDQVLDNIKHIRFNKLKELYESQVENQNKKYIGKTERIMIEGTSKNNDKMLTGRTDSNKVIIFEPVSNIKIGDFVNIKIEEDHKWFLEGKIIL